MTYNLRLLIHQEPVHTPATLATQKYNKPAQKQTRPKAGFAWVIKRVRSTLYQRHYRNRPCFQAG